MTGHSRSGNGEKSSPVDAFNDFTRTLAEGEAQESRRRQHAPALLASLEILREQYVEFSSRAHQYGDPQLVEATDSIGLEISRAEYYLQERLPATTDTIS